MRHTIDLTPETERKLEELARQAGVSGDQLLRDSIVALVHPHARDVMPVRETAGVMGGDACIRETRIPIWLLVQYKRAGLSDGELLQSYPSLNASDLAVAWDYFAAHSAEIESQMRRHEE